MQIFLRLLLFYFILLSIQGCSYEEETPIISSNDSNISSDTNTTKNTVTETNLVGLIEKSLTRSIDSTINDVEQNIEFGNMNSTRNALNLSGLTPSSPVIIGLRFTSLAIPKDAEITSAYIQFTAKDGSSVKDENNISIHVPSTLTINAENAVDSKVFGNEKHDLSTREKISLVVTWEVDEWLSSNDRDVAQQSASVKSLVQKIINQEDWKSGYAMSFMITGVGLRKALSYSVDSASDAPELVITYNIKDPDTDNDGLLDSVDLDDDNDGILDIDDDLPLDATESVDTDGDGIGNKIDIDDDNDGNSDLTELLDGTDPLDKNDFNDKRIGVIQNVVDVAKYHRVIWNSDASTNAVIAFTPLVDKNVYSIKYGQEVDETKWIIKPIDEKQVFDSSITSYFFRATNLKANTPFYYRICEGLSCGSRYWFNTAPDDVNSSFIAIAGGDTSRSQSNMNIGNSIISKVRPLFVMHGGSFTGSNTAETMNIFLEDWANTFSVDSIEGTSYKRIYPLVPTHGVHEDNNFLTMCQVFGLDSNANNTCDVHDTYSAFDISPLLRVYTLNTQFSADDLSQDADTMNAWLKDDLETKGKNTQWRIAQYNDPMFQNLKFHEKTPVVFNWWSKLFFDEAMNIVIESDSGISKSTKIVAPSEDVAYSFLEASLGGTIYIGDGSWGNINKSALKEDWVQDSEGINQFKVLAVSKDNIDISSIDFANSDNIPSLSLEEREGNSSILPANISFWDVQGIGETTIIKQNHIKQSILGNVFPSDTNITNP